MRTIDWRDGRVVIVDQTRLPAALRTLELTSVDELVDAIARLAVRGAPALGAAGALGVVLAVDQAEREGWADERLVARLAQLLKFKKKHGLKICCIQDLIAYRRKQEKLVERE